MNRKEYILIAETLREYKENEIESLKFEYTVSDIDLSLSIIEDLESRFVDRLRHEYRNFDEVKFKEATRPTNIDEYIKAKS
jgi:hypothetical protein